MGVCWVLIISGPSDLLTSMIHPAADFSWSGQASGLWFLFGIPGMTTARLTGRVAGVPTGPGCSFLGRRDGLELVRAPSSASNKVGWAPGCGAP
jgi:hypothetical protein